MSLRQLFLFLTLSLLAEFGHAQKNLPVLGRITDTHGKPLCCIGISVVYGGDTLKTISDLKGVYRFVAKCDQVYECVFGAAEMKVQHNLFKITCKSSDDTILPVVILDSLTTSLRPVIVSGKKMFSQSEDTLKFNTQGYKVAEFDPLEELFKKIPGLEILPSGQFRFQGKIIEGVRIDGKDFFDGNVLAATKNIPAIMVEQVQVINDYGDIANLTGIKSGTAQKIINITIKKDKKSARFGHAALMGGTADRYGAGGMLNSLKDQQQISFYASENNLNIAPTATADNAAMQNYGSSVETAKLPPLEKSVGYNYSNGFGKSVQFSSSGSLSDRRLYNEILSSETALNPQSSWSTQNFNTSASHQTNLKLSAAATVSLGSKTTLKANARFTGYIVNSTSFGTIGIKTLGAESVGNSTTFSRSRRGDCNADLFMLHRFNKRGTFLSFRTVYASSGSRLNDSNSSQIMRYRASGFDSLAAAALIGQTRVAQIRNGEVSIREFKAILTASEPLIKGLKLETSLESSIRVSTDDRSILDFDKSYPAMNVFPQSTSYNEQEQLHQGTVAISFSSQRLVYNIGIVGQYQALTGTSDAVQLVLTKSHEIVLLPKIRAHYKLSDQSNLDLVATGSSRAPDIAQVTTLIDSSTPGLVVIGNQHLTHEQTNSGTLTYSLLDNRTASAFYLNFGLDLTSAKIVPIILSDTGATKVISYANQDGAKACNTAVSYCFQLINKQLQITPGIGLNYTSTVASAAQLIGRTTTINLSPGLRGHFEKAGNYSFDLYSNYNQTEVISVYGQEAVRYTLRTFQCGVGAKYPIGKHFSAGIFFQSRFETSNYPYKLPNSNNLNAFLQYQFLKKGNGNIRLEGFDLLNANTGTAYATSSISIIETKRNVLSRYALLSANIRFQRFR